MRIFSFLLPFILFFISCTTCKLPPNHATPSSTPNLAPIYFDLGSDVPLQPEVIQKNAAWLKANPQKVVVLEGNCDELGNSEFNLKLGDRRARAVMKALMDEGVNESQVILISYGKEKPIIKTGSEKERARNRRVDFILR